MIAKRYFAERLRRLLPLTIVATVVILVCHSIEIFNTSFSLPHYGYLTPRTVSPAITFVTYLASVYALFLPFYLFGYRFNRKKGDILYSLPISKKDIAVVHYLSGYASVASAFCIPYLVGILLRLFRPHDALFFANFFSFLPVAFILLLAFYSLGTLCSIVSKSRLDGILLLLLLQIGPFFLGFGINSFDGMPLLSFAPITAVSFLTLIFDTAIGHSYVGIEEKRMPAPFGDGVRDLGIRFGGYDQTYLPAFLLLLVLALLVVPALLFLPDREKSEEAGLPSTSFLGLRSVLPFTCLCIALVIGALFGKTFAMSRQWTYHASYTAPIIYLVLALLSYLVLDLIRRRKISFTLENGIVLSSFLVAVVVFGVIGYYNRLAFQERLADSLAFAGVL